MSVGTEPTDSVGFRNDLPAFWVEFHFPERAFPNHYHKRTCKQRGDGGNRKSDFYAFAKLIPFSVANSLIPLRLNYLSGKINLVIPPWRTVLRTKQVNVEQNHW